jgi:hypothetical protein
METAKKTIEEEIREAIKSLDIGKELIRLLGNPLPPEAIQRTKDKQTHKGYDTDGYCVQFCVNRLNEVLGTEWGVLWEIMNQDKGSTSTGKPCWEITVKIGIWVLRREDVRWQAGGHVSKTHFDALKGAVTNGFKKAAALWGVGRHAFEGALDDDNDPWPDWAAQNGNGDAIAQGNPATDSQPPKQQTQPPKQQTQPPKQQTQPPKQQTQPPKSDGNNGQETGQQNGHTSPPPPVGNGKEAGLRRRITAQLETIFGSSGVAINQWLQAEFKTLPNLEAINNLDAQKLEIMLEIVEKKFKAWKVGSNN